jgi:type I restriction enzyme R subunit
VTVHVFLRRERVELLIGRRSVRSSWSGLGVFIRRLVGLDRAAKDAFATFLDQHVYSANQIEFVNLLIDELAANGVIEPRRLYESPFTDLSPKGPDALFESTDVDRLLDVVADVRDYAMLAAARVGPRRAEAA